MSSGWHNRRPRHALTHGQKATAEQKALAQLHMQAQQTHVAAQQAHAHAQTQAQTQAQAQAQQQQQLNTPQRQQTHTVTALNENAHHDSAIQRTAPTPTSNAGTMPPSHVPCANTCKSAECAHAKRGHGLHHAADERIWGKRLACRLHLKTFDDIQTLNTTQPTLTENHDNMTGT